MATPCLSRNFMSLSWFFSIPVGIRYIVMSALGFSLMTALVKLVSVYNMPLMEIVAARSLVSFIISFLDPCRHSLHCDVGAGLFFDDGAGEISQRL